MKEILTILKKELLEIFRDKSTFIFLFIPIFIFPVFNAGINYLNKDSDTEIDICIRYDSQEVYEIFSQYISISENYDVNIINSNVPMELLKKGEIDCYINIYDNNFELIYNSNSYNSLSMTTKFAENFQQYYNSLLSKSHKDILIMNLKDENNEPVNTSISMYNLLTPIIIMTLIFQSISSFANDLFAGEKERKTFELLLLSGVRKKSIYFGKTFALLIISIINSILILCSYFISFDFNEMGLKNFKFMQNGIIEINIICIILTLLLLSIIAVFLSSTASLLSKNMKNSQILNEIILAIPVGLTALLSLGILKNNVSAFYYIPVLNLIMNFNNAFIGNINIANIVSSLIINSSLVAALIFLSVKYMNTEKILY